MLEIDSDNNNKNIHDAAEAVTEVSECNHGTFHDVTPTVFQTDSQYWNQWFHSGKAYLHTGPPVFTDINNDHILDYFNPMHWQPSIDGIRLLFALCVYVPGTT